jgi:hypothetical protein
LVRPTHAQIINEELLAKCSASASAGKGGSALDVLFINAPAEGARARYADRAKGSSQ